MSAYVPCAIGAPRDLLALIDERAHALGETRTGYLLGLARADLAQARRRRPSAAPRRPDLGRVCRTVEAPLRNKSGYPLTDAYPCGLYTLRGKDAAPTGAQTP